MAGSAGAVAFKGTNAPGAAVNFKFSVKTGTTNMSIVLPGSSAAFSYVLARKGSAPTDTVFDFSSRFTGTTNTIYLEKPEVVNSNWFFRVLTPANSATHVFTLTVKTNIPGFHTGSKPTMKPLTSAVSFSVTNGEKHFFRFEMPTNLAWQIKLDSTNPSPDLYIQKAQLPAESSYTWRSLGLTNDAFNLSEFDTAAGTYYIGVFSPPTSPKRCRYTLTTKAINLVTLAWDPGLLHEGTQVYTNNTGLSGDYYFKIVTTNSAFGVWRTALNVVTGEANIYMTKGALPTVTTSDYKSERVGSDGFVLSSSQFSPSEVWYMLVRASAGAQWTLMSGSPYVKDLGSLTPDGSSGSGPLPMGPEGMRFFRTTVPPNVLAWSLWLNGATNQIFLKKTSVPLPTSNEYSNKTQILVVPPYLVGGFQYFICVPGDPGTTINLDSREHAIADLAYGTSASADVTGFGFVTYRVQVPLDQLAWQMNVPFTLGDPNVAVRRNFVPNERYNDAFSDLPSPIVDSISLVPPNLSDGTFYITVYGTGTNRFQFTLQNGTPSITDISYVSTSVNDEVTRAGWKYYRVANISEQLGSLGWELYLTNAAPGTRIAVRRNAAPSIWNFRNPQFVQTNVYDYIGTADFLQRPAHQADVWYVGVYSPSNALGPFTLYTREIYADPIYSDGDTRQRNNVLPDRWEFFRVTIPSDVLGWDIRVKDVSGGSPQVIVRREAFPVSRATFGFSPLTATNWPSGAQWAANIDWTRRRFASDGTTVEDGRILAMGMLQPMEAATYYVGVLSSNLTSYTLISRYIGAGYSIPVIDLNWNGGTASGEIAPREVAYYRVSSPAGIRSWKVRLTTEAGSEAMLLVATNRIPHVQSEKRMQKLGKEHFLRLPSFGYMPPIVNYLAVVGEGSLTNMPTDRVSSGNARYTLECLGEMPEPNIGTLGSTDFVQFDAVEGGESKAYNFYANPWQLGYFAFIENRVGYPAIVTGYYDDLFYPGIGEGLAEDPYGNVGGSEVAVASTYAIIVPDVSPLNIIMVKARFNGSGWPDSTYKVRVKEIVPDPLAFDGGSFTGLNEDPTLGRYFAIDVPPNAVGWDIRIRNITRGRPMLLVRREALAIAPYNSAPTYGFYPTVFEDTQWDPRSRWGALRDWTERIYSATGEIEDNRILAMGMGRPLQPGRYYACVVTLGSEPMSYELISRGIGDGMELPTRDLSLVNGVASGSLPPREADYYRVTIPYGTPSWKVKLSTSGNNESLLVALKDTAPNLGAKSFWSVTNKGGHKMQKPGSEHFLLLPEPGRDVLGGTYYLTVVGEGQSPLDVNHTGTGQSDYTLTSFGPAPVRNLGTISSVDSVDYGSLEGGEVQLYQWYVPSNTVSMQVSLEDRVANPMLSLRYGTRFPDPGAGGPNIPADYYGNDCGELEGNSVNATFLNIPNPTNGIYSLAVKARAGLDGVYSNATYTLKVRGSGIRQVDFDGGTADVRNQPSSTWNFFQIDVPPGVDGWDVRLTNVTSGSPKIVVRRNFLPNVLQTVPWSSPYTATNWASSNQWVAGPDWTRRNFNANGTVDESGRILAMGMGRPLQPGTYFVGVINQSGTAPMSYTLVSRGIGPTNSIPLVDLPFAGGTATYTNVAPREAAYFRVIIPSNAPSWKVKHAAISGESMMVVQKGNVPSVDSVPIFGPIANGRGMQQAGNEQLVLLPAPDQTNITPGVYYLAVISEGENPSNLARVGTGTSSFSITSLGAIPVHDFGTLTTTPSLLPDVLEGGETKAYQFSVRTGAFGVKIRLEQRVGNPFVAFVSTNKLPDPGGPFQTYSGDYYGNEGGYSVNEVNPSSIALANPPPGVHSLAIKARFNPTTVTYPASSYILKVQELQVDDLNFDPILNTNGLSNAAFGQLEDNERTYYRVVVPTNFPGPPIIGWKLDLRQSSGTAYLRVRKDSLPSDTVYGMMNFQSGESIISPPFLTNGTWYVEIKGSNTTSFTVTSTAVGLERPAWKMPGLGEPNQTPGLTLPYFADSGVDTNGAPLPADQGIFLEQGTFHYYAVNVPTNNGGLMRVTIEAISGNPDVYARTNFVPTLSHGASGGLLPLLYDRSMTQSTNTEYANWVPMNGRLESELTVGTWYLAVRAGGNVNARYRLRVATGNVADLTLNGAGYANQIVAGGDWRYYRIHTPTAAPVVINVTFSQTAGDVVLHFRDTSPPGNGTALGDLKDWNSDQRNTGSYPAYDPPGTYTITSPQVPPGSVFYFGFRAVNDATFNVSATLDTSSSFEPQTIAFYGGSVTDVLLPRYSSVLYRIDVPPDGVRWKHYATNSSSVGLYLEGGTIPQMNSTADWRSSGSNALFNIFLGNYPWFSNRSYFLVVTNTSLNAEVFTFRMDGRNALTDDDDNDGMLDAWERQYFGNTGYSPAGDFDGDGVTNLAEFQENTNPTNNMSFRPRLTINATVNGTVTRNPAQSNYAMGDVVMITGVPNAGYVFAGWSGSTNGLANPLMLVMNTNKTLGATFKYPGDDFAIALPLSGSSASATATNYGYTKEVNEPSHAGNPGGKSIWWKWTAPGPGSTTIKTMGSNFDTLLGVYTGPNVSNLTVIASDNHVDGFTNRSRVTFNAVAGTTYAIAVDGYNAATGTIQLTLNLTSSVQLKNLVRLPNGTVQFAVIGSPSTLYYIDSSSNLSTWTPLSSLTTSVSGTGTFTDNAATNIPARAYRARSQ